MNEIFVSDVAGRKIGLRTLNPADMLDLLEAAGSASSNGGWVRYATVICSVSSIDGVPVPLAGNKGTIKSLALRIGNDGFAAITKYLYGDDIAADPAAKPDAQDAKPDAPDTDSIAKN